MLTFREFIFGPRIACRTNLQKRILNTAPSDLMAIAGQIAEKMIAERNQEEVQELIELIIDDIVWHTESEILELDSAIEDFEDFAVLFPTLSDDLKAEQVIVDLCLWIPTIKLLGETDKNAVNLPDHIT